MEQEEDTEDGILSLDYRYRHTIRPLQFAEISMLDKKGEYLHHYKSRFSSESVVSSKIKRLIQEVGTLSTGMPLYIDSSVFSTS